MAGLVQYIHASKCYNLKTQRVSQDYFLPQNSSSSMFQDPMDRSHFRLKTCPMERGHAKGKLQTQQWVPPIWKGKPPILKQGFFPNPKRRQNEVVLKIRFRKLCGCNENATREIVHLISIIGVTGRVP